MVHLVMRDAAFEAGIDAARPANAATTRSPQAVSPRPLDFTLVTTRDGLAALEADWNTLFAASAMPGQVFQKFGWCWHWFNHYAAGPGATYELAIVTGRSAGRLYLVLPLAVSRTAGLRQLSWAGEPVSQYGDLLASPEAQQIECLEAAWSFAVAATRADFACLRKVRAGSLAARLLAQLPSTVIDSAEAPYLSLASEPTFEVWEERRQPRARKNRRRQARRLTELGEVRFEKHTGSDKAGELGYIAAVLKREALEQKGAIAPTLADPRFAAFFADVARAGELQAATSVYALTVNGEPAALKVLVTDASTRYLHIAVFDPRFEKCGAGALLLEHVIRSTIDDRYETLDLLAPRHGYKMDFADGVEVVDNSVVALSVKGAVYAHLVLRQRGRAKALFEALPAPLRKLMSRLIGR